MAKEKNKTKIEGLLWFPLIFLIFISLVYSYLVVVLIINKAINLMFFVILTIAVLNVLSLVLMIFKKKMFILFFISSSIFAIIVSSTFLILDITKYPQLILNLVINLGFIIYTLKSERVKETFIK